MIKNVFVTGSFDLLHSGHIAFLKQASLYGKVFVGIGSDRSIELLKKRPTIIPEQERLFMIQSIRYVEWAWINSGIGIMDFVDSVETIMRFYKTFDIMIVNKDQDYVEKNEFCKKHGLDYIVLERKPEIGLLVRSSTKMREYYD